MPPLGISLKFAHFSSAFGHLAEFVFEHQTLSRRNPAHKAQQQHAALFLTGFTRFSTGGTRLSPKCHLMLNLPHQLNVICFLEVLPLNGCHGLGTGAL